MGATPHSVKYFVEGKDTSRSSEEQMEHFELQRAQSDFFAVTCKSPLSYIEPTTAKFVSCRFL
jgi:hypothetical protein